jgi:hypothetical protein
MTTRTERPETIPSPEVQDIRLDSSLAKTIVQRRFKAWVAFGLLISAGLALYCLYVFPQTYSAKVSLSLQRSSSPSSPLSSLVGGLAGGGGRTYMGVLNSRQFAEKVEKRVKIQRIYGLPTFDDAVERIQKGTKAEENLTDGLTYVTVTLPALARFAPDPNGLRAKVKKATADIANAYAVELGRYMKTSDTDSGLAMQRQAELAVKKARSDYDSIVNKLALFIRNPKHGEALAFAGGPPPTSSSPSNSARSATASTEVTSLYLQRAELEQKITEAKSRTAGIKDMLTRPDEDILKIPDEDPVLGQARAQVNEAQLRLDQLRISLANENPQVLEAKKQYDIALKRFKEQLGALLKGQTTDTVKLRAMEASAEVVKRQIKEVERNFQVGSEHTTELEILKNEVELRLKVLETASSRNAEMAFSAVTAQNRMSIIDEARPPLYGKPGLATMLVMSLFMPLLFIGAWFVIEYVLNSTRPPRFAAATVVDRPQAGSNGR